MTLLLAYLISSFWLGELILFVPAVIEAAPLGLTSLFYKPSPPNYLRTTPGLVEIWLHIIFWTLFFVGTIGSKNLPLKVVTGIYVAVIVLLMLTLRGCALHYAAPPGSLH